MTEHLACVPVSCVDALHWALLKQLTCLVLGMTLAFKVKISKLEISSDVANHLFWCFDVAQMANGV